MEQTSSATDVGDVVISRSLGVHGSTSLAMECNVILGEIHLWVWIEYHMK